MEKRLGKYLKKLKNERSESPRKINLFENLSFYCCCNRKIYETQQQVKLLSNECYPKKTIALEKCYFLEQRFFPQLDFHFP